MFVNGNSVGRKNFQVEDGSGGVFPGGSSSNASGAGLGQFVTTTAVDRSGCPVDSVARFYADETIYVAVERSSIPKGTEIFARLNYQNSPVEDTDVIRADRDMDSCVWFVFEPGRGGFDAGDYTVELFVNGSRVDRLSLVVE